MCGRPTNPIAEENVMIHTNVLMTQDNKIIASTPFDFLPEAL